MKKICLLPLSLLFSAFSFSQTFTVTLKTPSYKGGVAFLCYHMGKNLNIEDSTVVNTQGVAVFTGNRTLPGGIYSIVFPGKRLTMDFFIDKQQTIEIIADSADLTNAVVKGSKENDLFQQYQQYVVSKGTQMQVEKIGYSNSRTKKDSSLHEENYARVNKELNEFRDSIIVHSPQSMMTLFLKTMKEPEILYRSPKNRKDSVENFNYYKAHYWDGITFMDDRILRTPFFLPKLERYSREVIPQSSDTIINDIDYKLLLARTCPEMYKFLLNWLTDEYISPKYMGQDAIFVHLFEKYHSKGVSSWLNEKQMETISRRAYMQMSNLIGVRAANIEMLDSTGKKRALYDQPADYMILIFWDPSCGHCKE
jgi:hypothetical protein